MNDQLSACGSTQSSSQCPFCGKCRHCGQGGNQNFNMPYAGGPMNVPFNGLIPGVTPTSNA